MTKKTIKTILDTCKRSSKTFETSLSSWDPSYTDTAISLDDLKDILEELTSKKK